MRLDPNKRPIRRGDAVRVFDVRADDWYPLPFVVISADAFHDNGRNEVQVCEFPRPFKPVAVLRKRCQRLGHLPEALFNPIVRGLSDLIRPGKDDDVTDSRSVPGSTVQLDVNFSDGITYGERPALIVSRPLLANAYDILYFMDISSGLGVVPTDYVLQDPDAARLTRGSFVKARLWWTERSQMELYNRARISRSVSHRDLLGSIEALDRVLTVGFAWAWTTAPDA